MARKVQLRSLLLVMKEILHHLGALNYSHSEDFRDLKYCKISSINSIEWACQRRSASSFYSQSKASYDDFT